MSRSLDPCAQHEKVMCDECQLVDELAQKWWLENRNEVFSQTEAFKAGFELGRNEANAEIDSLKAMIKLWEERNSENVREIEVLKAKLEIAKRYFILIRIPPIEKAKTAYEYQALWERSRNDADEALKQITEVEGDNGITKKS